MLAQAVRRLRSKWKKIRSHVGTVETTGRCGTSASARQSRVRSGRRGRWRWVRCDRGASARSRAPGAAAAISAENSENGNHSAQPAQLARKGWGRAGRPCASEFEHSHPLVLAQGSRGAASGGVRQLAHGTGLLLRARFVVPPTGRCSEPRPSLVSAARQRSGEAVWPGSRQPRSSSWCSPEPRRHSFIQELLSAGSAIRESDPAGARPRPGGRLCRRRGCAPSFVGVGFLARARVQATRPHSLRRRCDGRRGLFERSDRLGPGPETCRTVPGLLP